VLGGGTGGLNFVAHILKHKGVLKQQLRVFDASR